jgi:hypothetical protein
VHQRSQPQAVDHPGGSGGGPAEAQPAAHLALALPHRGRERPPPGADGPGLQGGVRPGRHRSRLLLHRRSRRGLRRHPGPRAAGRGAAAKIEELERERRTLERRLQALEALRRR